MTLLQKVSSTADYNFGYGDIPYKSRCLGFWLFGVDQATSITNLTGGAALEVPGSAATYTAHSALFGPGAYFRTPFTGDSRNRFCALVTSYAYTDSVYEAADSTVRFPPIYGPGPFQNSIDARAPLTWNGGAQFLDLGANGPWFRAGTPDIKASTVGALNYAYATYPIADPDGTWQDYPSPMAIASGPSTCEFYLPNQRVMRSYSVAQSGSAPANAKTVIGNIGSTSSGKVRIHSFGEWTYLNASEAAVVLAWLGAQANADGYRNTVYYPDQAA